MLNKSFKKVVVSAMLGISVITASVGVSSVVAPVTVEAATAVAPTVSFKAKTFTVGLGSQLNVYKNVIKSVKKGTYPVKAVKITAVKAKNGKKIGIKNSSILTTGKIPAKILVFPKSAGTYKLKVVATDTKGNKRSAKVSFKVDKKLSSHVKGLKNYEVAKGSSVNFMKGITFNKSYVKSVKCNSAMVDLGTVGTYKVAYTIVGVAGDTQKVTKKVQVNTYNAGNTTPSENPASHVKGVKDIVMVARSKNVNLMQGITWDNTIKSVKVSSLNDVYDPTHFDLPWDGNNVLGIEYWASYYYAPMTLEYTVVPVSGSAVRMSRTVYIVDLPTAKDLAQYIPVYASNNTLVKADPDVRRICELKVTATKITVPRHGLAICFNCYTEMTKSDVDWHDEHYWNSYLALKGQGPEGAVPGCSHVWYDTVEAFTINR